MNKIDKILMTILRDLISEWWNKPTDKPIYEAHTKIKQSLWKLIEDEMPLIFTLDGSSTSKLYWKGYKNGFEKAIIQIKQALKQVILNENP